MIYNFSPEAKVDLSGDSSRGRREPKPEDKGKISMVSPDPNWNDLDKVVSSWLTDGCARIEDALPKLNADDNHLAFLALYCLRSAIEYLGGAFESFKAMRFSAGLCCCRPVYETAITFMWCAHVHGDKYARIQRWIKTTKAQKLRFLEELKKTSTKSTSDEEELDLQMSACKEQLADIRDVKELPNLKQMLTQIDPGAPGGSTLQDMYITLYTFACSFAHAPLELDRYFQHDGNSIAWLPEPEMPRVTRWVVMTIAYCMAVAPFMVFDWDYSNIKRDYVSALEVSGTDTQLFTRRNNGSKQ